MFDILKEKEFWIVSILSILFVAFFNSLNGKDCITLCEMEQYEYCNNEELEELLKKIIK